MSKFAEGKGASWSPIAVDTGHVFQSQEEPGTPALARAIDFRNLLADGVDNQKITFGPSTIDIGGLKHRDVKTPKEVIKILDDLIAKVKENIQE